MADLKTLTLPIPSFEYDENNESITRRTLEQSIEDLNVKLIRIQRMQESVSSKSVRRHQFLLMGAKHG
tara:strand:+ start:442 stop:645 length:204 start_codon:yes stop_codon:yes gene_type:complete